MNMYKDIASPPRRLSDLCALKNLWAGGDPNAACYIPQVMHRDRATALSSVRSVSFTTV